MLLKKKVLVVVGPTAIGKSSLAVTLAQALGGEIISADSRQVYRHMDIGTAKPTLEQRSIIPHHLVDIIDPDENYNLALFLRQVGHIILSIKKNEGLLPIVVGGTGQYIWGFVEGWQIPEVVPDLELRAKLERQAESDGGQALFQELSRLDPQAAARVDPQNVRRVIRALEVYHSSGGQPRQEIRKIPPDYDIKIIGLTMERAELYRRIDDRIDAMVKAGWIDEVKNLLDMGYSRELPALSSLGYSEIIGYLDNNISLDEAVQRIKFRTHRFARRQYAWFKLSDERIRWFDVATGLDAVESEVRAWLDT